MLLLSWSDISDATLHTTHTIIDGAVVGGTLRQSSARHLWRAGRITELGGVSSGDWGERGPGRAGGSQ